MAAELPVARGVVQPPRDPESWYHPPRTRAPLHVRGPEWLPGDAAGLVTWDGQTWLNRMGIVLLLTITAWITAIQRIKYVHDVTTRAEAAEAARAAGAETPPATPAGASAPQVLVDELIARLKELGALGVRQLPGITESVVFTLPRELARQRG